ncbi:hypothetical protein [Bacillus thuringiensis]|uniref:hypothetical protein n=1 Tax=Bacillus thuringiensis TaxID=1428 RepID=UPI000BFB8C53|nr:hypothetical protein [Bacillus thuringiensis]PGT90076.1 hypothetical protein COD17_10020 [Bacillus thuringiensis]
MQLTETTLRSLYESKGLSVTDIERKYNLKRNAVTRRLKKYGIEIKETVNECAVRFVSHALQNRGYEVAGQGEESMYDLLIDNQLRVKVLSSAKLNEDEAFRFALTDKCRNQERRGNRETACCYTLPNGRVRKRYKAFCEVLALVGICEGECYVWFLPAKDVTDTLQTLRLPITGQSKYNPYRNRYGLLDTCMEIDSRQIG